MAAALPAAATGTPLQRRTAPRAQTLPPPSQWRQCSCLLRRGLPAPSPPRASSSSSAGDVPGQQGGDEAQSGAGQRRRAVDSLGSLDILLGSGGSIDDDLAAATSTARREEASPLPSTSTTAELTWWRNAEDDPSGQRRVRPIYVYVIYYLYICVYLAYSWLEATDGDVAAATLRDGLVNDHLAVAGGEMARLATAGFFTDGPFGLFLVLATLLTVGAEAEAMLGYGLFWAVFWLASMTGNLADAAFSELPITFGPANPAAGMVGALVAYVARNWGAEGRLEAARQSSRRLQLGLDYPQEQEVEVAPFLKFNVSLSAEARSSFSVLVAMITSAQGLLDIGDAMGSASWIGLLSSFWAGLVLSYLAGPKYEVKFIPNRVSASQQKLLQQLQQGPGGIVSAQQQLAQMQQQQRVEEGGTYVLESTTPVLEKRVFLVGFTLLLGVAMSLWPVWAGQD